ncbi:dystroglycan-like [Dorcoceras hygrometricum]|uniref:Dystroglycan-like n=1 Tax=Dorcoceras hygrometricum TaxID=472368 RepID=A0A2Z7AXS4_9LAMI|nr:dystroglycan-like [Dorcoceras hygrometricum]
MLGASFRCQESQLVCPAVIYESELVDFFNNGSVRDGLVVSTVNGVPVEFSEQLFVETFELPVNGLADLSEMPKDKIFDARSIVSLSGEPVSLSGRKGQTKIEYRLLCDIMAKAISVKVGSLNALTVEKFSLLTAVVCGIRMNWASILFNILKKMVSAGSKQAKGFAIQISLLLESIPNLELGESTEFPASKILTDKTVHRYISFNDKVVPKRKRTSKKKSGSSQSPLEIMVVAQESVPLQMVGPSTGAPTAEEPIEQPAAEEDISAAQPVDKVTGQLRTTAVGDQQVGSGDELSKDIETETVALSVDEAMSLEDIFMSIPADVQLPSAGVEITRILFGATIHIPGVTERTWYLARLPKIPVEDKGKELMVEKDPVKGNPVREQLVLVVAEIELLVQLREKVINAVEQFFHSFSRKNLAALQLEDVYTKVEKVLTWAGTDSPIIALNRKRQNRDRGAVIARSNTTTRSSCWIRTMIRVNGTWVCEPCADQWVKIPQPIISSEIPRQRQYDDTLPPVSEFFRLKKKRWADVCLEVVAFCILRRLLPVGFVNFCRGLPVGEPFFRVAPRQSPVFALRVSQFCSVFIDFSLFSWLPTADITDFLSSIAMDRTIFRDVQIAQNIVSVSPSVQMLDEPSSSDSSSDNILMDFADQDTAAAANSLPAVTVDLSSLLDDLKSSLSQRMDDSNSEISSRLHSTERSLQTSLGHQNDYLQSLIQSARQEGQIQDDAQILRLNELKKAVAAIRSEQLEFQAKIAADLLSLSTQIGDLVDYIRGGDAKKGEGSSSRPQPPPSNVQGQGSGGNPGECSGPTAVRLTDIADRIREDDRRQMEEERERERQRRIRRLSSGSHKRRRGY